MRTRTLLLLGALAALAGCKSPPAITIELTDASFAATGSNLFNCTHPANPAVPHGLDVGHIECDPQLNADGTYSSTPVTVTDVVGCQQGHGAIVSVTCLGSDHDLTVSGTVTVSINSSCNTSSSTTSPSSEFMFNSVGPGQTVTSPAPLQACADFDNVCTAADPCEFTDFHTTISVTTAVVP